jgi:hypothetical protein
VDAKESRSDLVFNEPIETSVEQRGVEGLVLTEWKLLDSENALTRYEQARAQTHLYKDGPLRQRADGLSLLSWGFCG